LGIRRGVVVEELKGHHLYPAHTLMWR
jgi:hypothetical protein